MEEIKRDNSGKVTYNSTLSKIIKFPKIIQDSSAAPRNMNNSEVAHELQLEAHNANKKLEHAYNEHSYNEDPMINVTDRLIDYINGGKQ